MMGSDFILRYAVLPLMALTAVGIGVRWCVRTFRRRRPPVTTERCRCGYSLENLSVARCPECGRVINFDATPEQLGLSNEQLERA